MGSGWTERVWNGMGTGWGGVWAQGAGWKWFDIVEGGGGGRGRRFEWNDILGIGLTGSSVRSASGCIVANEERLIYDITFDKNTT